MQSSEDKAIAFLMFLEYTCVSKVIEVGWNDLGKERTNKNE